MSKWKVEFSRTIAEYHVCIVEAETEDEVMQMYEDGELEDPKPGGDIVSENEPDITLIED